MNGNCRFGTFRQTSLRLDEVLSVHILLVIPIMWSLSLSVCIIGVVNEVSNIFFYRVIRVCDIVDLYQGLLISFNDSKMDLSSPNLLCI